MTRIRQSDTDQLYSDRWRLQTRETWGVIKLSLDLYLMSISVLTAKHQKTTCLFLEPMSWAYDDIYSCLLQYLSCPGSMPSLSVGTSEVYQPDPVAPAHKDAYLSLFLFLSPMHLC